MPFSSAALPTSHLPTKTSRDAARDSLSWRVDLERVDDAERIDALLDEAFGRDRRRKTSYRYRDGVAPIARLARTAWSGERLIGAIRFWPILLDERDALLLGPLAIARAWRGRGVGRALAADALKTARADGHRLTFLVGDPAYYERFGFAPAPSAVVMPGEDPARLMARRLDGGALQELAGTLLAQRPPSR